MRVRDSDVTMKGSKIHQNKPVGSNETITVGSNRTESASVAKPFQTDAFEAPAPGQASGLPTGQRMHKPMVITRD